MWTSLEFAKVVWHVICENGSSDVEPVWVAIVVVQIIDGLFKSKVEFA